MAKKKQKVTRTITRLQVHHMWMPDYSCWSKDNALRRQKNTKDFHIHTNHWDDIAQHFSIFPDGHIVTGRTLNKTPIGIRGWNTNAICVEIYGNFDKGHDKMTVAQKEAVIGLYGELCKRFNIKPSTSTIRPHCWFTAGGAYLGKYDPNKSAKTCPGTKYDIETQLNKGVAITIVAEEKVDDGGTWCKAKSDYWVNKKYLEFVKYV